MNLSAYFLNLGGYQIFSNFRSYRVDSDEDDVVRIYSSSLVPWDEEKRLESALSDELMYAIVRYIEDKKYIPRLILSAIVFLLIYFFLSFAVRDPIPLLDEILVSAVITAFFWIYLKKRDKESVVLKIKYKAIEKKIEEENLTYLDFLSDVEHKYSYFSSLELEDLVSQIVSGKIEKIECPDVQFDDFCQIFSEEIRRKEKALYSYYLRLKDGNFPKKKFSDELLHAYGVGSFDLSLLALVIVLGL